MAAVNPLDIDPKNLAFDFKKDWLQFRDSRVQKFLVLRLKRHLANQHLQMEICPSEQFTKLQGAAAQLKEMVALLQLDDVTDQLKQTIEYIEKSYGK